MEKRNGTPWLRAALALPAALLVGAAPALAQETETEAETETETMDYTTETAQQCTLSVVPPVVAVGEEPVTVVASLSNSVGTVTTAGADAESGLVLALATDGAQGMAHAEEGMDQTEDVAAAGEAEAGQEAETETDVGGEAAYGQDQAELGYDYGAQQGAATVNLELDTSAAQVGQWQIWVEGAEGTCEGALEVAEQGQTDMGLEETPQVDPYETDTEEPQAEPFPQDEPVQDEPLN